MMKLRRHRFNLSTRSAIILTSVFLWVSLWSLRANLFPVDLAGAILPFISLIVSFILLREHAKGIRFFTLLTPPVMLFTATLLLLTTLSSGSLLWLIIWGLYGPLSYVTYLSQNIFAVGAQKEEGEAMPLLRAAQTTAFTVAVATGFLLYSYVYNIPFSFLEQLLIVFLGTFALSLPYLWSFSLEETISRRYFLVSLAFAFFALEGALAASFFPLKFSTRGLLLSTLLYSMLGLSRYRNKNELTLRILGEYGVVLVLVIVLSAFFQ